MRGSVIERQEWQLDNGAVSGPVWRGCGCGAEEEASVVFEQAEIR